MAIGVSEFRRLLLKLGGALDSDIGKLVGALAAQDPAAALAIITDAYPELVSPYLAAAGDLSATWYEDQPAKRGAKVFTALPAELPPVEQLASNGRWALTQKAPTNALQGAGRRQLFKAHRDTVLDNAKREDVRWVREARPGACGFCRMQATRVLTEGHGGAPGLYRSEKSAGASAHQFDETRGHDHCRCLAVPLRGGLAYTVPGYVHDWLDDYEAVSRDESGRLLSTARITALMEARARDRGELVGEDVARDRPAIIDLDTGTTAPATAAKSESAADVAARHLPLLEQNLANLRAAGHSEDSGPVTYHKQQIERLRQLDAENLDSLPAEQAIPEPAPAYPPPAALVEPAVELVTPDPDPVVDVQADDHTGETALDRAVREFEEAVESGDDARIDAAAEAMDRAEQAEQKARDQAEKAAARRRAAADSDQDRMFELIEGGEDPQFAEAEVLSTNADGRRRVTKLVGEGLYDEGTAQKVVFNHILERIRRRDFMIQARADGHSGKGFDDLLDSVFQRRVDELYIEAENATRGQMVKRQFALTFDPKRFWYCNDATARKYMSDELAEWFDDNGRVTRPVMRQMILDGSNSFGSYTAMRADYLQ